LGTPLPALFGANATIGTYLLGVLGVLLIFLSVSGAIVWWPGLRGLISGFVVRRGRVTTSATWICTGWWASSRCRSC